jgi:catalase
MYGNRGTPYSYRHMNGYGSHTYKMVNAQGQVHFVKFHLKTNQGVKNLRRVEAIEMNGKDPDFATRDLFQSIQRGEFPSWSLYIQAMTPEQAESYRFNVLDVTKIWPHSDFPLIPVGQLVWNRNPTNYHQEVEQSAFSPAHLVPGIEASNDKMLQGRLFSYVDTHRHRLGANYSNIPINCPFRARVATHTRDGPMRTDGNSGNDKNYFPGTYENCPQPDPSAAMSREALVGEVARHPQNHPNCDFE